MSKTLIILAAVLVLIVIVIVTGMRYLRADDDAEEFPADREAARRGSDEAGHRAPPSRSASRRSQNRRPGPPVRPASGEPGSAATAPRQRRLAVAAEPAGVSERAGSPEPASSSGRAARRRAAAASGRRDDAAGRRDSDQARLPVDAQGRQPGDDTRLAGRRSGTAKAPAGARQAAKRAADDWPTTDWDSLSDVDYWAEVTAEKPLTGTSEPATPAGRTGPGPMAGPPVIGAEPATLIRPLSAAADDTVISSPPRRQHRRTSAGSGHADHGRRRGGRTPAPGVPAPDEAGLLPGIPPLGRSGRLPASTAFAGSGPLPGVPDRPDARTHREAVLTPLAATGAAAAAGGRHSGADDDPLTSPSFPRIAGTDSRSYGRRPADWAAEHARTAGAEPGRQPAGYLTAPVGRIAAQAAQSDPGFGAADDSGYLISGPHRYPAVTAMAGHQSGGFQNRPGPAAGRPGTDFSDWPATGEWPSAGQSGNPDEAAYPPDPAAGRYQAPPADSYRAGRPGFPDRVPVAADRSGGPARTVGSYPEAERATAAYASPRRAGGGRGAHAAGRRGGREQAPDTVSYSQPAATFDEPPATPGPATWYLGMDSGRTAGRPPLDVPDREQPPGPARRPPGRHSGGHAAGGPRPAAGTGAVTQRGGTDLYDDAAGYR